MKNERANFIKSLQIELESLRPLTVAMFILSIALYFATEKSSSFFALSREMLIIGETRIPYSSFAGVSAAVSNTILILIVVSFGKIGYCTCMGITIIRFARLAKGIFIVHNIPSLPGTFIALSSLIAIVIIYRRNEAINRMQKEKLTLMKEEQEHLNELFTETARALVSAIDAKDRYTHGHSTRVAEYSKKIALRAGKSEKETKEIYFAALLHDVGKIGVSDTIINKSGKLTDEEFTKIKKHPVWGWEILSNITDSPYLSIGAHYHHEKYDGHGYPEGLSGKNIPDMARIIAVADAYDAMTSKRSYRSPLPQEVVRSEIENGSGSQFDPVYAKIMLDMIDEDKNYEIKE